MKLARPRFARWAAWLGVLALAINALVPIHIAFDLADAFGAAHRDGAHSHTDSAERSALARLSGHSGTDGESHEHGKGHGTVCPVCGALGALAGFAPAAGVSLPLPPPTAMPAALAAIGRHPAGAPLAYRSRAPPAA